MAMRHGHGSEKPTSAGSLLSLADKRQLPKHVLRAIASHGRVLRNAKANNIDRRRYVAEKPDDIGNRHLAHRNACEGVGGDCGFAKSSDRN